MQAVRRGLRYFLLFIHLLVAVAFIIACFAPVISPELTTIPAFLGLTFPIWLGLNLVFGLYWVLRNRGYALISIISILIFMPRVISFIPINILENQSFDEGFELLTYNVRNFDKYNEPNHIAGRNRMLDIIEDAAADIICFQEFYTEPNPEFNNVAAVQERTGLSAYYLERTYVQKGYHIWGLAIFTRFPILNTGVIEFPEVRQNRGIYCDLLIDNDTIRLFNLHMQSIYLSPDDVAVFKGMETEVKLPKSAVRKLQVSFKRRAYQARLVREIIADSPYPVVVCGDFNDTPVSYTYQTIRGHLQDAFIEKGTGSGRTYAGSLPGLRIDYVLPDNHFKVLGYKRLEHEVSDHFPVLSSLKILK